MEGMIGNENCRQRMAETVEQDRSGVFFVTGPWGLGKRTFLQNLLDPEEHGLFVDSNIDGVRSVIDRLGTASFLGGAHDVVILDCDRMSLPAQDACLKLLEEPPPGSRVWIHATDPSGVNKALQSRRRDGFRWSPLGVEDMARWAAEQGETDKFALEVSAGRPGCYSTIRIDPRFAMLHETVLRAMKGSDLLLEPLPLLLVELDGESPLRESVFMTLTHAAKTDPVRGLPILRFASKIMSTAMNVELHWFTAVCALGVKNG